MTQMQRNFIIGLTAFFVLFSALPSHAAVESTGEINVLGDDQGRVPASSTVTLIVTLVIDRSRAEPGEDIKTIEIILPNGFIVQPSDLKSVSRNGERVDANAEVVGSSLRIVLFRAITDFSNSINEIIFSGRTPNTIKEVTFQVRLRNPQDQTIGEFIKPGNADGKSNNNDFTLQVIPNVPPEAVQGFTVASDLTGENDVTIQWQKSEDADVTGYFIYRDNDPPINAENRSSTVFRDVNVTPGSHTYAIEAYKTPLLRSKHSLVLSVVVSQDTAPPKPPERFAIAPSGDGVKLTWNSSPSRDVVRFQFFFGTSPTALNPLFVDSSPAIVLFESNKVEYEFIDRRRLGVGVSIYAVEAIDEAGNRSKQVTQTLRIFDKPFPNPFTPLSSDRNFNRVVFPARALEDAEGEFSVSIFDLNGSLVYNKKADPGVREIEWNGQKDGTDEIVESGVYVYQMQVGGNFQTGTLIVAK